jgi:hypothetical protein
MTEYMSSHVTNEPSEPPQPNPAHAKVSKYIKLTGIALALGSFLLLTMIGQGGAALPVGSFVAAIGVFSGRSFDMWARHNYRRRLKAFAKAQRPS